VKGVDKPEIDIRLMVLKRFLIKWIIIMWVGPVICNFDQKTIF